MTRLEFQCERRHKCIPEIQVLGAMHQHLQHQREHQPEEIKGDELLSFADTNDCSSDSELDDVVSNGAVAPNQF